VKRFEAVFHHAIKSCGCLDQERKCGELANHFLHGGYNGGRPSPEMRTYENMLTRCYNRNSDRWKFYGARGVKVTARWLGKNGFKHFLEDMGPKPTPQHTLGRVLDVPLYSARTCEWQTLLQQGAERRGHRAQELFAQTLGPGPVRLTPVRKKVA
jgi:hypothetical protein